MPVRFRDTDVLFRNLTGDDPDKVIVRTPRLRLARRLQDTPYLRASLLLV